MSEQHAPEALALRNMLSAMQNGELTVSRGIELVDMWLAGNYNDDLLPPAREGLGEDEMPWDRIDALTKRRDELEAENGRLYADLNTAYQQVKTEQRLSFRDQVADLERQRDELRDSKDALHRLSDPICLHQNLIRGLPARLTREQLLHLAGATDYDEIKQQRDELLKALQWYADRYSNGNGKPSVAAKAIAKVRP